MRVVIWVIVFNTYILSLGQITNEFSVKDRHFVSRIWLLLKSRNRFTKRLCICQINIGKANFLKEVTQFVFLIILYIGMRSEKCFVLAVLEEVFRNQDVG